MKHSKSRSAVARRLTKQLDAPPGAINVGKVRTWEEKGYPLDDPEKLRLLLLQQRTGNEWLVERAVDEAEGENLPLDRVKYRQEVAKMLAGEAIASLKQIELQALKEKWETKEEVKESGRRVGSLLRSHLLQIPGNWAPLLEGLDAAKMQVRMREEVGRLMGEMSRVAELNGIEADEWEDDES